MGGAFAGLADDASSLYWNPAGLATVTAPEISLLHTLYVADTRYQAVGYTQPSALGTVGSSVNLLNYGKIPRTLERTDGLYGGPSGTVNPQDLYLAVGWGGALVPGRLRAGITLRGAFQQLSGASLAGGGINAGLLWDTPVPGCRLGLVAENLGSMGGGGRMLPVSGVGGASFRVNLAPGFHIIYAADVRQAVDAEIMWCMGGELALFDAIFLRGGWRAGGNAFAGPSAGVGLEYPLTWFSGGFTLKLDYAAADSGELGRSQRFQLGIRFGTHPVRLGSIGGGKGDETACLTWKGRGPEFVIYLWSEEDRQWTQVTDRSVKEKRYPLIGFPPGKYVFRVVSVDPLRPDWIGPESGDLEVVIEPTYEPPPEAVKAKPVKVKKPAVRKAAPKK